jgi:hypothetical protein
MDSVRQRDNPPIYTVLCEIVGWSMDRTADLPKSQRFTFGQRLDNLSLDALQLGVKAIRARRRSQKIECVQELDLLLEQLRALWRLVNERGWISRQQLTFIQSRLDETGRMVGGWLGQLSSKSAS